MFLLFEYVQANTTVLTIAACHPPAKATGVMLQATSHAGISYTMDGVTTPTNYSMILSPVEEPEYFSIDDFKKIKFRCAGDDPATLLIHYLAGRDI
jgi:hypothetical protein